MSQGDLSLFKNEAGFVHELRIIQSYKVTDFESTSKEINAEVEYVVTALDIYDEKTHAYHRIKLDKPRTEKFRYLLSRSNGHWVFKKVPHPFAFVSG